MLRESIRDDLRAVVHRATNGDADTSDTALHGRHPDNNWRRHIPSAVESVWPLLSEEARLAVILTAMRSVKKYQLRRPS